MSIATIDGIELHYREAGEGFPVVLVHGFTGNLRNWALTVPALRERFRTVSVDLPGHGLSEKPTASGAYTGEQMSDDVHGLIRHLGIEECYLVGHSMGGMVAQHLVLSHPPLIRALVLVDTAAELSGVLRERASDRERLVQMVRTRGMEAVFDEQLRLNPQREQIEANPGFVKTWREQFLMTSPDAYIYCAHGMANRRALLRELPSVSAPTLIVCGENDEPFVEASRQMHDAIAGSELLMIPGAGHSPQIEAPSRFNQALMGFLTRVHEAAGVA